MHRRLVCLHMTKFTLFTNNPEEWHYFIASKHKLPLIIEQYNPSDFYAEMSIYLSTNVPGSSFSDAMSCKQKFTSGDSQDGFLFAHSKGAFSYEGQFKEKINNRSFILDLSEPFAGRFIDAASSKSIFLPFDLMPGKIVDNFKKCSLYQHPLYFTLDSILRSMLMEDSDISLDCKIAAVVNLLSIDDLIEKADIIKDLKIYMLRKLMNMESFNLDIVSRDFCMSRRKLQYVFSSNKTTYMKVLAGVKLEFGKLQSIRRK